MLMTAESRNHILQISSIAHHSSQFCHGSQRIGAHRPGLPGTISILYLLLRQAGTGSGVNDSGSLGATNRNYAIEYWC